MPFLRRYAIIDVEIASGGIRVEIKTAAAIGMGAVGTVYAKRLYDQYGSHFLRSQTMNGQSGYAAAASHWMGRPFSTDLRAGAG